MFIDGQVLGFDYPTNSDHVTQHSDHNTYHCLSNGDPLSDYPATSGQLLFQCHLLKDLQHHV